MQLSRVDGVVAVPVRAAKEEIGRQRHRVAHAFAAQKTIDRHTCGLAHEIPAGNFDRNSLRHVAHLLHQSTVVEGRFADHDRRDDFLKASQLLAKGHRMGGGDAGLADAGKTFVRLHAHEGAHTRRITDSIRAEDGGNKRNRNAVRFKTRNDHDRLPTAAVALAIAHGTAPSPGIARVKFVWIDGRS